MSMGAEQLRQVLDIAKFPTSGIDAFLRVLPTADDFVAIMVGMFYRI